MVEIIKRLIRRYRVRSLREKCLKSIDLELFEALENQLEDSMRTYTYLLHESEILEVFPNQKNRWLTGKRYRTEDELVEALNARRINPIQVETLVKKARKLGGAAKYLEYGRFIDLNVARVVDLNLDRGRSKRVLDLGCGGGYFLFALELCGHKGLGVDRETNEEGFDLEGPKVFDEIRKALHVDSCRHTITPEMPMPKNLGKFDMITAFNCWFDGEYSTGRQYTPWDCSQWRRFLENMSENIECEGRIHIETNDKWEYAKDYYFPEDRSGLMPENKYSGKISGCTLSLIRK